MLVTVPKEQTLTEAAASWMMFGTAYALIDVAKITAGDVVVINAASSSVGIAAIQIAKDHDAIPIAVTRGEGKVAALKEHGAAYVIVSDEEDVSSRIMEITEGRGARIAFDAVAGQPLDRLLDAMAPQGIVIVYGMLAGHSVELMLPKLMMKNLTLRGFSADLLIQQRETRAKVVDYVSSGLRRGALKPVIDRTFDLWEIAAAHRYLESGTQLGKIVVTTGTAND
jgi:NADPH:quinone reductase-like Zn-dependent oxidoreductase